MRLPGAERAIVAPDKVRDYLLSPANPRARGKAQFFQALGFGPGNWEELRDALMATARTESASPGQNSEFGTKFEIRATLTGPAGREAVIKTVWIINAGDDCPRLVTAFPD